MAKNTNEEPGADQVAEALQKLADTQAVLAQAIQALMQGQAQTNLFLQKMAENAPLSTKEVNARVAAILANKNKVPIPDAVDAGFAVLCSKNGKRKKLVDAYTVMQHGTLVDMGPGREPLWAGAHAHDLEAETVAVEQFKPYPSDRIVKGPANFFNWQQAGFVKAPNGVYYNPVLAKEKLAKAFAEAGQSAPEVA